MNVKSFYDRTKDEDVKIAHSVGNFDSSGFTLPRPFEQNETEVKEYNHSHAVMTSTDVVDIDAGKQLLDYLNQIDAVDYQAEAMYGVDLDKLVLTDTQKKACSMVLDHYHDIFATSDMNLRKTDKVQHIIDRGDNYP